MEEFLLAFHTFHNDCLYHNMDAVIGRKRLSTFQKKHNNNESEFYFDMVYHLLKDRLNDEGYFYQIILAGRTGSSYHQVNNPFSIEKASEFRRDDYV